jgi:hypothetical protein
MADRDVEYTEVNAYLRYYSSLRFVMVSVCFAVSAAVTLAAFRLVGPDRGISLLMAVTFRLIGLGITVVFFSYEWRLEELIRYYQRQARELENNLPYKTMQERPQSDRMFRATRGLYIMFMAFWILSVIMFRKV